MSRQRISASPWTWALTLVTLYALAAWFSLWLSSQPGRIAALWFANPIGTLALLGLALRHWTPALLALALVNLLAHLAAISGTQGWGMEAWLHAAAFVPGSVAEILMAAWLLRRLRVSEDALRQPGRFGRVLLAGALIPSFLGAFVGAPLVSADQRLYGDVWGEWFAGSLVGTAALLPLALALWLQGLDSLRQTVGRTRTLGLLLLGAGVSLLAVTTLPQSFVVVSITLVFLAAHTSFAITALGTLLTAVLLELLQVTGVLIPPPTSTWWSECLFHVAILATLLPGLFLASSVEGQKQARQQLQNSEQRFRDLYSHTPAMMHSIDPQGRLISVSDLWLQNLGYEAHEVLGHDSTEFMTRESARYSTEVVRPKSMRDGRCDYIGLQMVTRSGQVLDVLLSAIWIYDKDGRALHSLAVVQDVTAKKRLEALSHFAQHDPLTGLPNRMLLQDRLERSCVRHARHGTHFAVGFLDLDHFKSINDNYGHEAGDLLLKEVARRLLAALRASDTVCRLAGDEFILLFSEVDELPALETLAGKVLTSVARPCRLGENLQAPVIDVAASMGIALFPEHGQDPQTLVTRADQAMYAAKRAGRNRVGFYLPKENGRK